MPWKYDFIVHLLLLFATNNDETLEKWMNIIFIRYDLYIFLEFLSYLIPIGVIMSYLWIKDVEGFRL